jgi:hypothetical protein
MKKFESFMTNVLPSALIVVLFILMLFHSH